MKNKVTLGLEIFLNSPPKGLKNKRLGLLANPASVDSNYNHAVNLINKKFPNQLKAIFSPQHGFYAEKQDNMIESDHFIEPELKIPVYSLYNESRIPTKDMFKKIDVLIIDIQDVGTRVYTFIYTISYCLEVAASMNKKVIILDRPNPIGGNQIEGNVLLQDVSSFVGRFPIPMRHGLTIGEISSYFNTEFGIGSDLSIIPMKGWQRNMYWQDTNLSWVMPSPNLPTAQSCMVYPGQVIFEGTNISEGRGTTLPFEQFGAPFLDTKIIKSEADKQITGAVLRPVSFQPTSGKWQGEVCNGFQIHVTNKESYSPYHVSLVILQLIIKYHGDAFKFKEPPYEYEFEKLPLDLILGSKALRKEIAGQSKIETLTEDWQETLLKYKLLVKKYYLYE